MTQSKQASTPRAALSEADDSEPQALGLSSGLSFVDPELFRIAEVESARQRDKLILIASESLCPDAVLQALASPFHNLYAEGYPSSRMSIFERDELDDSARQLAFYRRYADRRYYRGCDYVNLVESLAISRLADLFATDKVPSSRIHANVQPLSGAAANNAVYEAFLEPGETVMGMNLSYGGHLTHGSPVNRSGKRYRVVSYTADPETGAFDWERMKALAAKEAPKLVIAGFSAFPWSIDWGKFREVADASPAGAILLADISHPSGLVAGKVFPNPIEHVDVISMTTHKSLCGPRGAVLLTPKPDLAQKLDLSVFPGEQGGPHINSIAAMAVAFRLANTEVFRTLMKGVVENALALAEGFKKRGLKLAYGGTDTHLVLIDLKTLSNEKGESLSADVAARMLDMAGVTCNKNSIAGDLSAAHPSGLRFGTTWVTQRGLGPEHMDRLASIVADVLFAIRPFSVEVGSGFVGRGRIRPKALSEARIAMAELIRETTGGPSNALLDYPHFSIPDDAPAPGTTPLAPVHEEYGASFVVFGSRRVPEHFGDPKKEEQAARTSCVLCDNFDKGLIAVCGERAMPFLQASVTADVARLIPGLSARSLILDESGEVIDDILVHRIEDDSRNRPVYWLSVHAPQRTAILERLWEYSDGYVDVDPLGDPCTKVDGPVVIRDLAEAEDVSLRMVGLGLAGPKALMLIEKVSGIEDVTQFQNVQTTIAGEQAWVSVASIDGDRPTFEIYVSPRGVIKVYRELLSSGKQHGLVPAGLATRHALRKEAGLPVHKERETRLKANDPIYSRWIGASKPWFVGSRAIVPRSVESKSVFEWVEPECESLKRTPLFEDHAALTKKWNLVPFAGWEMPVLYTSISEEHATVRLSGGLFDVSHMGVLELSGEGSSRFLDLVTTNYVDRLRVGGGQYSYVLDVHGSVLDDILVYRIERERFMVVVNAANAEKIEAWWRSVLERRVLLDVKRPHIQIDVDPILVNLKDPSQEDRQRVDIALQGRASSLVLDRLLTDDDMRRRVRELERFGITPGEIAGIDVLIARTGYTGEDVGFELYVHPDRTRDLWREILKTGEDLSVKPAGLGSRDSTRTEAGFPLWGHELAGVDDISPMAAGYGSFVKFHKPFFVGRDAAIEAEKNRIQEIIRFQLESGARAVRAGDPICDGRGRVLGRVTSCAMVGANQIGLAYVKRDRIKPGGRVEVFPLPRTGESKPEKARSELDLGDTVLLSARGSVLTRFLTPEEKGPRWS